ncbi:MAG: bifunctional enoyl-CoA hydratase/phosphate acetyltransferase [Negativicutes bacterium]|nr:bifunctional enoyl-CoA hydratase/phosphate acetyltransferase [Negativicutes bacterium]
MIRSFDQILKAVCGLPPKRVVVAVAQDDAVLEAVKGAREQGVAEFSLVGDAAKIQSVGDRLGIDLGGLTIVHEPDDRQAALRAVTLVSSGEGDILMKGLLGTADLLRAVLDKQVGLRSGRLLSHVIVSEPKGYDRLILLTDCAMNIAPTLQQKAEILENCLPLAARLGMNPVKIAALAAVETVNPDMQATLDAAALAKMADRGRWRGAVVDGPLALDNALSAEAARHKGISSPVAGAADVLLVPGLDAGNVLFKAMVYFGGTPVAGLVLGAAKPVVLTSRADSFEAKIMSIALAALLEKK